MKHSCTRHSCPSLQLWGCQIQLGLILIFKGAISCLTWVTNCFSQTIAGRWYHANTHTATHLSCGVSLAVTTLVPLLLGGAFQSRPALTSTPTVNKTAEKSEFRHSKTYLPCLPCCNCSIYIFFLYACTSGLSNTFHILNFFTSQWELMRQWVWRWYYCQKWILWSW